MSGGAFDLCAVSDEGLALCIFMADRLRVEGRFWKGLSTACRAELQERARPDRLNVVAVSLPLLSFDELKTAAGEITLTLARFADCGDGGLISLLSCIREELRAKLMAQTILN